MMCIYSPCPKTQVADKKASFLRLSKLEKCESTVVNDHFESKSNEKNGALLLTLYSSYPKVKLGLIYLLLAISFTFASCNGVKDKRGNEIAVNTVLESDSSDVNANFSYVIPSAYDGKKKLPVIYLFDPHANGSEPIEKYAELADKFGYILVASNEIKNGTPDAEASIIFDNLKKATHKRFKIDKKQQYTAGFSGGAKYAIVFAYKLTEIRGVIACGGTIPFPSDYVPHYYYSGIVGNHDFNYIDVVQTSNSFAKNGFDFTLETFNGGHEWPPVESFKMGIIGLKLYSIKLKTAKKDDDWVDDLYETMFDKAYAYDEDTYPIERYKVLEQMSRWFYNIRSIADIKLEIAKVENSSSFNAEVKKRSQLIRNEVRMRNGYIKAINTRDIDWWKGEVAKLNSSIVDIEVNNINKRVLSYISMACFSFINSDLDKEDFESALNKLHVYDLVENESFYVYLTFSKYYFKTGDSKKMVEHFNKAVENGFTDFHIYAKEDVWKELLNQKEIINIIE